MKEGGSETQVDNSFIDLNVTIIKKLFLSIEHYLEQINLILGLKRCSTKFLFSLIPKGGEFVFRILEEYEILFKNLMEKLDKVIDVLAYRLLDKNDILDVKKLIKEIDNYKLYLRS